MEPNVVPSMTILLLLLLTMINTVLAQALYLLNVVQVAAQLMPQYTMVMKPSIILSTSVPLLVLTVDLFV